MRHLVGRNASGSENETAATPRKSGYYTGTGTASTIVAVGELREDPTFGVSPRLGAGEPREQPRSQRELAENPRVALRARRPPSRLPEPEVPCIGSRHIP